MPAVLVHGVPDTAEMWDPLVERLHRDDLVLVRLPGFGAPVPAGFTSTKDEYADWLAGEVSAVGEPVDLVGHDWGSLLTQRVATTRPELVRTYVLSDGAVSSKFRWHELAKQWQTPGVGEEIMQLMTAEAVAAALRDAGHPDSDGAGARADETMKTSVLALYRSAVDIADEWTPKPTSDGPPALVVWGARDPYGPPPYGRAAAELAHATYVELDAGHWAIVERPAEAAGALETFWAGG
jgi:pimeloyl-ACP methyl ester carboxylesterase